LAFFLVCIWIFLTGRYLDVLTRRDESLTLAELARDSGFARSTVIIHLERLASGELILKEKKPSNGHGRPEFQYRPGGGSSTQSDSSA
jgi:predicted ArsR family transcriptional regulator